MPAPTDTPVARVEQLARSYDASAKVAAGENNENVMQYQATYDRAYAAGLRHALAMLADEPDDDDGENECDGHEHDPANPSQMAGVTYYCDGSCKGGRR